MSAERAFVGEEREGHSRQMRTETEKAREAQNCRSGESAGFWPRRHIRVYSNVTRRVSGTMMMN